MLCPHCDFSNGEDDHRCLQCGRLLPFHAIAAPASPLRATATTGTSPQETDRFSEIIRQATDRLAPVKILTAAARRKADSKSAGASVAHPMRRLTAAAIDVVMVLLGFGVYASAAWIAGSAFGGGEALWITGAESLLLLALFYGLIWAVAMRETAGMRWMRMKLIALDGSPVDGPDRVIRFVSVWLSYCAGGLGLLWTLADKEGLALHDRASNTYPAEVAD